jgi:hypothetical protein
MKKRPSKQPAVPTVFTSSLKHTDFRLSWHISGDVESVMLTMKMEAACSSKTLATTLLPHGAHMQKQDLYNLNKTGHILITKRCGIENSTNSLYSEKPGSYLLIEISYLK